MPKRKFDVGNAVDILRPSGKYFDTGIIKKWQWSGDSGEFCYYIVSFDRENIRWWVYESGLVYAHNPPID